MGVALLHHRLVWLVWGRTAPNSVLGCYVGITRAYVYDIRVCHTCMHTRVGVAIGGGVQVAVIDTKRLFLSY